MAAVVGDCGGTVEALHNKMYSRLPKEAMKRAKELGCDTVHTHRHEGETLFMPCSGMKEYEEKNQQKKPTSRKRTLKECLMMMRKRKRKPHIILTENASQDMKRKV